MTWRGPDFALSRGGVVPEILFVEDEPTLLLAVSAVLRQRGFAVTCASERRQAEKLLTRGRFACLITDLCLADGRPEEGWQVIAFAREHSPETRIVILTGLASESLAEEAERLRVDAVLQKPQSLDELERAVRAVLEAR